MKIDLIMLNIATVERVEELLGVTFTSKFLLDSRRVVVSIHPELNKLILREFLAVDAHRL